MNRKQESGAKVNFDGNNVGFNIYKKVNKSQISDKCNGVGKDMLKKYLESHKSTKNTQLENLEYSPIRGQYGSMPKNREEVEKLKSEKNKQDSKKYTFKPEISQNSQNLVKKIIQNVSIIDNLRVT